MNRTLVSVGKICFECFLHRLIVAIQTLFSSPCSSRTCWPLASVSIRRFRWHTPYRGWTPQPSSLFLSLGRSFAAVLVGVPAWCAVSMLFWEKQITVIITALLYYIPCTLFSRFSDLLYGGKQSLQEWTTVIAVHLVNQHYVNYTDGRIFFEWIIAIAIHLAQPTLRQLHGSTNLLLWVNNCHSYPPRITNTTSVKRLDESSWMLLLRSSCFEFMPQHNSAGWCFCGCFCSCWVMFVLWKRHVSMV